MVSAGHSNGITTRIIANESSKHVAIEKALASGGKVYPAKGNRYIVVTKTLGFR